MPKKQSFNNKIKAWVIYDFKKGKGFRALNVKQRNPTVPFKNVPIASTSSRQR